MISLVNVTYWRHSIISFRLFPNFDGKVLTRDAFVHASLVVWHAGLDRRPCTRDVGPDASLLCGARAARQFHHLQDLAASMSAGGCG